MKSLLAALPLAFISFNDFNPLNANTVTVSGLSSGSMMAGQMLVAASAQIKGAGLIAGGPFNCGNNSLSQALKCIDEPETINVENLVTFAKNLQRSKKIDSLANLKNRPLFILNGTEDTVVRPLAGTKTLEFFENFISPANIKTEFNLKSGHSFPTSGRGRACETEGTPWINNCGYDAAQNTLEHLLHKKLVPGKAKNENFYQMNIAAFASPDSDLNTTALIYVPQICRNTKCDLHVVFHGCRQTLDEAGWDFITQAGYNDWAEANNLVIFYPNIIKTLFNPKGCWDWWGYTTSDYNNKQGPQIKSVLKIINRLAPQ